MALPGPARQRVILARRGGAARAFFAGGGLDRRAGAAKNKDVEPLGPVELSATSPGGSHQARRGAVAARQAHNLEVAGSNPAAATFETGPVGATPSGPVAFWPPVAPDPPPAARQ